jgi:hypothetical protein
MSYYHNYSTLRRICQALFVKFAKFCKVVALYYFKPYYAAGISERTHKRAKQSLGVRSVKISGGWLWSIPDFDVVDVTDYEQYTPPENQECQMQSLALLNVT